LDLQFSVFHDIIDQKRYTYTMRKIGKCKEETSED